MTKILSRVFGYVKSCSRFLTSKPTEKNVEAKQEVVYGGDLPHPIEKNSFGSILFYRLLALQKDENRILQISLATKHGLTAKNVLEKGVAVAERLREENIKKGDVIVLIGDNSLNLNLAVIGTFFMGAIPAPLSDKIRKEELKIILKSIQPKLCFVDSCHLTHLRSVLHELPENQPTTKLFFLNERRDPVDADIEAFKEFVRGRGNDVEAFKPAETEDSENDLALMMKALTQGSQGRIVGITHRNINAVVARYDAALPHRKGRQVALMVQKLSWMSGLYSLILSCCYGAKLVVMREFNEERFMEAIEEYKVSSTILYNFKMWQLYKYNYPRQYDVASFLYILSIDGSLPQTLIIGMKEKLGLTVRPAYGISELTGLALQSTIAYKPGSTGKLVPLMYAKVVSEKTYHKVGPNQPGIICFKGPTLTKGYVNDKKSTRLLFDKEGFLVSEMYGYYDKDGFFYVLDKIRHVIRHKDCEISPRELEGIIKSIPAVRDVAVAGVKHPSYGYCPLALVVLSPRAKLTAEEVIKHVDGIVDDCKRLRGGVIFVTKIPRAKENGVIRRYVIDKILSKYQVPAEVQQVRSYNSYHGVRAKWKEFSSVT